MADKPTEDPLVAQAFDTNKHEDLARAIQQLDPEEAAYFLTKLEAAIKKRKIQITGYFVAMIVWLVGMMFALAYYGLVDGFVGWVFLVPFGLVGGILWFFGRWAENVTRAANEAAAARIVSEKPKASKPAKPAKKADDRERSAS